MGSPFRPVFRRFEGHINQSSRQDTPTPYNATPVTPDQVAEHPREADSPQELPDSQDEPVEQPTAQVDENPPTVPRPPETNSSRIDSPKVEAPDVGQTSSDGTPIWTQSMKRFAEEKPELYEVMKAQIGKIQNMDVDNWDTWSNDHQPKESEGAFFRRCKAYLPQLKSSRHVALSLSNLDPHKIAPWVTAGVFLAAEVGHNCIPFCQNLVSMYLI